MLYPKDPNISVIRDKETLKISYKWPWNSAWLPACTGLFFAFGTFMVLNEPLENGAPRTLGDFLVGLAILGSISVALLVAGAAFWLNKTSLTATTDILVIETSPVSFRRRQQFEAKKILRFFAYSPSRVTSTKSNDNFTAIFLMDTDQVVHRMVATLPSRFASNQVVHELQIFYCLEDLPIFGVTGNGDQAR